MKLPKNKVLDRLSIIEKLIINKNVLHIGFTDYPFTQKKFEDGTLFHTQIMKSCKFLAGIDLNAESVNFLKTQGVENIFPCDLYELNQLKELSNCQFDFVLFSEVIEHLPNPGLALKTINKFIQNNNPDAKLILTAPNYNNFIFRFTDTILNTERVHPDHYYYFSYRTLSKLLFDNNFEVIDFKFVLYRNKNRLLLMLPKLLNLFSSSFMPYLYFLAKSKT